MKINIQEQIERASTLIQENKDLNLAEDILNGVLNLDPSSTTILFALGTLYLRKKYNALAIQVYKRALEINDKLACVWNNLGFVYREEQKRELAEDAFVKASKLNPNDADCWANLGGLYVADGRPEKAIVYMDRALKVDPNHECAKWNRSLAYLEQGDYSKGFEDYDAGVRTADRQERVYQDAKRWDGTRGKTVVVYGEQGIGDEIMFASVIPDLMKDCNVIFDAHPRLYEIFRHSFPNIPIYGTRKDNEIAWPAYHRIDAKIAIGSLAKFYRRYKKDFPGTKYLSPDPMLESKYHYILTGISTHRMNIGISWAGGIKTTNKKERTIALEKWLPIFKNVDANFISLQYVDGAQEEINKFTEAHGIQIHHWQDTIDDYDETAALVSNLDMVISVPQSVVHLAGALGVPTFQLTPRRSLWQMGVYGEDMPWYGETVKNIWQETPGEWDSVIEKTKDLLCNLYQMSIAV